MASTGKNAGRVNYQRQQTEGDNDARKTQRACAPSRERGSPPFPALTEDVKAEMKEKPEVKEEKMKRNMKDLKDEENIMRNDSIHLDFSSESLENEKSETE